jgi:plasmid stabilization system protein ParE
MPAKFRIEIGRSAEKDVEDIWDYLSADNPARAREFISELDRQALTLEQFPERCPSIPENEILGARYRHLVYGNYRLIFRIAESTVFVLRILHGARLLDSSMFETRT